MASHRDRAKKKTRNWQLGAVALAGCAVAIGAMPIARHLGPRTHQPPVETALPPPPAPSGGLSSEESAALASRLTIIGGKIDVTPPAPLPEPGTDVLVRTDPEPEPVVTPTDWTYKSYLGSPKMKMGIITVNDEQILVRAGFERDSTKVLEVHPDHLLVDEGGAQKRLDIATRTVFWPVDGPKRPVAVRMPPPGAVGQNNGFNLANNAFNANNAAAMEAARRGKAVISPPIPMPAPMPVTSGVEMSADQHDMAMKVLNDQNQDPQVRMKMLHELGLPGDASPEERVEFLQKFGVTPDTDPKMYEHVKSGGGGKGEK